jgi:hypothetical protein
MGTSNCFVDSHSLSSSTESSDHKPFEYTGPLTHEQNSLERQWQTVEGNIQECSKVWTRKRYFYSFSNTVLITVAFILSTFVIPWASYVNNSGMCFYAGFVITGVICFQNMCAVSERARFYREIAFELWAVEQEFKTAKFDNTDDYQQLEKITTRLQKLIERDSQKVPTGRGLTAIPRTR